jgi:hypothetical protein
MPNHSHQSDENDDTEHVNQLVLSKLSHTVLHTELTFPGRQAQLLFPRLSDGQVDGSGFRV